MAIIQLDPAGYFQDVEPWRVMDALGIIPDFIVPGDDRSLVRQVDARYQHGGGVRPIPGDWIVEDDGSLLYNLPPSDEYPPEPHRRPYAIVTSPDVPGEQLWVCESAICRFTGGPEGDVICRLS